MKLNLPIITIIVLALSCLVFLAIYFFQFRNYDLSNNSDDWGNFGSYFAGGLGTILGFANLLLIYYTYNNQRRLNNRQQFESTFFELLKNHRENIINAIDNRGNLNNFKKSEGDGSFVEAYPLLKEFYEVENEMMNDSLWAFAEKRVSYERKHILTYRPLLNYNLHSKDYLIVIINGIADIYNYINETPAINNELKLFYKNILRDSITESEKFFLVLFFIQKKSFYRKPLIKDDILFFISQNDYLKRYLLLNEDFPFCSCGVESETRNGYYPLSGFGFKTEELVSGSIEYKIKPLLNPIIIDKFQFLPSHSSFGIETFEINKKIERMGKLFLPFNKLFEQILRKATLDRNKKLTSSNLYEIMPSEGPHTSFRKLELKLDIFVKVKNSKFVIQDILLFEFNSESEGYIKCGESQIFSDKYIEYSFGQKYDTKNLELK